MNTKNLSILFSLAVVLCALASPSTTLLAQTDTATGKTMPATNRELGRSGRSFIKDAAKSGMAEVTISKASVDRLQSQPVKDFAQMMISDHGAVNAELMALAMTKGVTLPMDDKDATKLQEKWSKKTKDLDEDYLKKMVEDHEDAVKLFEKASKSDDAEIAAFARKTLPALKQHYEMAKTLKKSTP